MNEGFRKFLNRFSKEIIIALIFAFIAAVVLEVWNNYSNQQAIENNKRAVATVVVYDSGKKAIAQGSGFFINSSGRLATNYHVIQGAANVIARLPSGAYFNWQGVVYKDESADVAILQFDARDTPSVRGLGNSDDLYAGETVYAMGTPNGFEGTVSKGNISNPTQDIDGRKLIQFTAPISPGSSGGGLFDESGRVVGITAALGEGQNLNFAVPINNLKTVLVGNINLIEGSPEFYYAQGNLADNQHQWDRAIEDYAKAIQLNDKYTDAYIGLAGDYYEKGEYDLEVQSYLKATESGPSSSDAFYYLATAYEDTSQYASAIDAYKKAAELNPDDKEALHDLAVLYLSLGDKNDAANLIPKLDELDRGWGNKLRLLINNQK